MIVPAVTVGRGAFTRIGKDNKLDPYGFVLFKSRDGSFPLRDWNYEAVRGGVDAILGRVNEYAAFYGFAPVPENGRLGPKGAAGIKSTQKILNQTKGLGLKEDGRVGTITAEAMWHDYFVWLAAFYGVPVEVLWGMSRLESGFDPGAFSRLFDPLYGPDRGIFQINQTHIGHAPFLTVADTFDPFTSIDYAARRYATAADKYDDKGPQLQRDCSIAQHNNPKAADLWYDIGWVGPDEKIRVYVDRVDAASGLFKAAA